MTRFFAFLLTTLTLFFTVGCDFVGDRKTNEKDSKPSEPVAVEVATPISRTIVDYAELNGRTAAVESVEIRAQVSGYLDAIHFQPGTFVKKGDVLFTLDARVYNAVLAQRTSDVSAKNAELKQLEADLNRQESLIDKNATSRQEYDLALAERDRCAAELEAAKANRDRAQIDVDYATVCSPIDGVVGRELVTVGNLVSSGTTLLTRVVAVDPLHVFFDVDERTLMQFRRESLSKISKDSFFVKFAVGDAEFEREARVDFSEPRLNETTGTLEFRAVAENRPNENGTRNLLPGLRLRVKFPTTQPYDALLVPEEAVLTDQNVKYVFIVDSQNKASVAKITLGPLQNDNMRVVDSGLKSDDKIVLNNLLKVRQGESVVPTLVDAKSNVLVVREDGTFIDRDGTSFSDNLYETFRGGETNVVGSKNGEAADARGETNAENVSAPLPRG